MFSPVLLNTIDIIIAYFKHTGTTSMIIWFLVVALVVAVFVIHFNPKESFKHKYNYQLAKKFLRKVRKDKNLQPNYLFGMMRKLNPFVFEEILLLCFEQQGYKIKRNKRYTGDGGIDGIIYDEYGRKILIQAKRYKSAINPQHVSDFLLIINEHKAYQGFFIHTGRTGLMSKQKLTEKLKIISGESLIQLVLLNSTNLLDRVG